MMKLLAHVLVVEFGVFLSVLVALLGWQVRRAWRGRRLRAEQWVLAAGAVVTCGMYAAELARERGAEMPDVPGVWVAGFGVCCALYVGLKAKRAMGKG